MSTSPDREQYLDKNESESDDVSPELSEISAIDYSMEEDDNDNHHAPPPQAQFHLSLDDETE